MANSGNDYATQYYISKKITGTWPKAWRKLLAKPWGEERVFDNTNRPRRKKEEKRK